MKKQTIFVVVGALLLLAAVLTGYRQHRKAELREAYGNAVDAFNRAYEYRDAGSLLYEPRWKDFQVAMDSFWREPGAASFAHPDWPNLSDCGHLLELYRNYSAIESAAIENADSIETLDIVKQKVKEWDRSQADIVQKAKLCLKKPF